jgi:hypothetical protein
MILVYAGVALLVVCGILLIVRRSKESKLLAITTAETTTAQGLLDAVKYVAQRLGETGSFNQIAAVKGIVRCDSPLTSEIVKQPCVYYNMSVTREYEEDYYETDSKTGEQTRKTRRESEQVAGNSQSIAFWVEDATGRTLVNPDHAEFEATKVVDRFDPIGNLSGGVLSFGGFSMDLGNILSGVGAGTRTLGYHLQELLVPLDRQIYVLGEARDSSGQLAIERPRGKGKKFIVSVKSQEELISATVSTMRWLMVSAVASGVVGIGLIVRGLIR